MKRLTSRSGRRRFAVLTVFALTIAACGGDDDADPSSTDGDADATESAGDTDTDSDTDSDSNSDSDSDSDSEDGESASSDEPAEPVETSEHVLQVVMSEESPDLVPMTAGGQGQGQVFQAIFMPLLQPDNENRIFSRILDSWEMSPDATLATLTLKPDIEWSDGTPMTSADVAMSLGIYLDASIANMAGRIGGVLGQTAFNDGEADEIEGLKIVDDLTVTVELETPNAPWLNNIAALGEDLPILPSHVLGDVPHSELLDHEYFRTIPVSSGPYKVVDFVAGQYAELERNDNWSLGTPGFEKVFMRVVSTDVMTAQLETGELDFVSPLDPVDVERVSGIEGVTVDSAVGVAPDLWSLMHDDGSLDSRVRQAMLFAIDREGICEQAMLGYCTTPVTNIRQISPAWAIPTVDEYPDLIEYTYDPDRARELLAEAEADGAWDPDTTLTFYHRPGRSYVDTAIAIAQAQMAEVGINWEIINTDTGGLIDGIREQPIGTLDGFWVSGADFTIDPSAVETYTTCSAARTGANLISYCRPELDELWAAGRQTAVQEERAEVYHEAFRFLNADPAEIYLYVVNTIIAHDDRLKGIEPHGGVGQTYWNIGEWYWEE